MLALGSRDSRSTPYLSSLRRSSRRLLAWQSIVPSESGSKAITTRAPLMVRASRRYQARVRASSAGPPPVYHGPQWFASARITVKIGTALRRRARTICRRTFFRKCGRVKRPNHSARGSLAILRISSALRRLPERLYTRHWCHAGEWWSTYNRTPANGFSYASAIVDVELPATRKTATSNTASKARPPDIGARVGNAVDGK